MGNPGQTITRRRATAPCSRASCMLAAVSIADFFLFRSIFKDATFNGTLLITCFCAGVLLALLGLGLGVAHLADRSYNRIFAVLGLLLNGIALFSFGMLILNNAATFPG